MFERVIIMITTYKRSRNNRRTVSRRVGKLVRHLIPFLCLILIGSVIFLSNIGRAECSTEKSKKLTSVCIEEGDSVWSIAENYYTEECGSMKEYVKEITKTNHLESSDSIHAGCYLVVPYYN